MQCRPGRIGAGLLDGAHFFGRSRRAIESSLWPVEGNVSS